MMPSMISGTTIAGDYQQFTLDADGLVIAAGERMQAKAEALQETGLAPDFLAGCSVLELGCDMGFWSFLASSAGARNVLALDRNRPVRGRGPVDLIAENTALARRFARHDRVHFRQTNLGAQWPEFGLFHVVLAMSVTHHVYAQCGDHVPVWHWLARHLIPGGLLVWEGPIDAADPVIVKDVPTHLQGGYHALNLDTALQMAGLQVMYRGPAKHEPTRQVWSCRRC